MYQENLSIETKTQIELEKKKRKIIKRTVYKTNRRYAKRYGKVKKQK